MTRCLFTALMTLVFVTDLLAKSNLPLPRFVSTRSTEANLRVGPGRNYPVGWIFIKPDIPVEITAEFESWRRIRDVDGVEGWFHKTLLKSQRFGIVIPKESSLMKTFKPDSIPLARLLRGVVVELKKCRDNWCLVRVQNLEGYLQRTDLWGTYPNEAVY